MIHESVGNPSSKLPRGVRRGSTTGLQGLEGMSLGGELVLVSACLTVTPPITGGQEDTHTPYSCDVVLVFLIWREIVFGTYVLSVQYSCAVVSVFLLWQES